MQGVVWSSFSRELNSILQVRTGCGQAPPVTSMVVPEPALISCGRWGQAAPSYRTPTRNRIFRTAIKAPLTFFVVVVASLSLWLQTGKYPKVRSPQSRKLKLVFLCCFSLYFFVSANWLIDWVLCTVVRMAKPSLTLSFFFLSRFFKVAHAPPLVFIYVYVSIVHSHLFYTE